MPNAVLITGASGNIGSALALEYAMPGTTLLLQGRRLERLHALEKQCRDRGADVHIEIFDIRDVARLREWVDGACATLPVDLVVVNAGVNINVGPDRRGERWSDMQEVLDVNVRGALCTIDAAMPHLRERRRGHIAIISSLAAYRGLPAVPSYSASKAALKAYGEAMRDFLAPDGVRVSVVMPGYIESPMARAMPGPKPFLMTPDRAARLIRRGLESNRPRIAFPFPLNLGTWLLSVIPQWASARILQWMRYGA
jgi:short-subunit dehydrogenase